VRHVATAPHEWVANYVFDEHGLDPYFAADRAVKDGGGSRTGEFEHDGEQWQAKLYYQESGIAHPGGQLPSGTLFALETIREYRIAVKRRSDEDPHEQQSFNAHIAPRWQGMESEGDGANPTVPDGLEEGINVRINGSNIAFDRYLPLLQLAAESVGIASYYFRSSKVHEYSNVQDAARYVRLEKDRSGPIHARDGPIVGLAHLLEHDRRGYRKLVQNDTDERGRDLPGYYHTVTLDPGHVQEAWPHHDLPREVKHYYAREAEGLDDENPLAHPKLEAAYQTSKWDESLHPIEDREQINEELEETIISVLADAGLDLRPSDDGPFVEDAYFEADEHDVGRQLIDLDLNSIRSEQESIVIKHVADGLSPVEWGALETLVTDGGEVSPADIADEQDFHPDSVRRALDRIDDLVEHEYGEVTLRSQHISELVHEAVQEAKDASRRAVEAGARAVEAAERGVDETTSALMAFCAKHGIAVDDSRDARLKLRMENIENVAGRLREAYRLWIDAGKDSARFRQARVDLGERGKSVAWYYLENG
jgi:hypothetical protein